MIKISAKEHRVLDWLARTGTVDWAWTHANTVNSLRSKRLIASDGNGRRHVTAAGRKTLAAVPNIFDDLFAEKEPSVPKTKPAPKKKPAKPAEEFRPIEYIETSLHDPIRDRWEEGSDQGGVRLYCTSSPITHGKDNGRWALQVRARVKTRSGPPGKHFAVGTASMSRKDLLWLRAKIDDALENP